MICYSRSTPWVLPRDRSRSPLWSVDRDTGQESSRGRRGRPCKRPLLKESEITGPLVHKRQPPQRERGLLKNGANGL